MKKILFAALLAASGLAISSCSTTVNVPGVHYTTFIDFGIVRAAGFEAIAADVPVGRTSIGLVSEVIRFDRTYTYKKTVEENGDDLMAQPKRTLQVIGNDANDQQLLAERIAQIIRERHGKGIANLKVTTEVIQNSAQGYQPEFTINGTIYE